MARLDRERALKRLDGEVELYNHMAGYFTRDYGNYPDRIGDLIIAEDREAYVITHSLKNIAASLGAESLASKALALETLLKNGRFDGTQAALDDLLEEFFPVLAEVRELQEGTGEAEHGESAVPGWSDFKTLLDELIEAMGSFSPDVVDKALSRLDHSASVVPDSCRGDLEKVRELARDFRYLEGEDLLMELKERVLE